ncbi:MAG: 16S rRNA (guanine(527)-N(7))-methyltransferase RsmG [Bacillales bacterium]|nr:16S rRNA (guanine(527)-N(7))-methyltransferase RsmG [Bacillales bacterium]
MINFKEDLKKEGIVLNDSMESSFDLYYKELIAYNEKVNLTRITEKEEVYYLHFYDSLMVYKGFKNFKEGTKILDIGSGAGFPGVPLKIVFPQVSLTIVEATRKKIDFLNQIKEELNLKDVILYHMRAEDFKEKEEYDLVTIRAVASLKNLSLYTIPFLKVGGIFIAMKSAIQEKEIEEAQSSINKMGGIIKDTIPYKVKDRDYLLFVIEKIKKSPLGYPRALHRSK